MDSFQPEPAPAPAPEPGTKPRSFHVYGGVDLVSAYFSRGILFSDQASIQPWIELQQGLPFFQGVDSINRVDWLVGNWNSFQDDSEVGETRSGNVATLEQWYEADFYTGPSVTFADHFTSSLRWNLYTSPDDAFDDIQEIDWRLQYNDASFWENRFGMTHFGLHPSLRITKELRDPAGPDQWFFQPALTPTYTFTKPIRNLTVKIPLIWGLGANGQYRNQRGNDMAFGAFQTGLRLSTPLQILPPDAGRITLTAGLDFIFLSDEEINFQGNDFEVAGLIGLSYGI